MKSWFLSAKFKKNCTRDEEIKIYLTEEINDDISNHEEDENMSPAKSILLSSLKFSFLNHSFLKNCDGYLAFTSRMNFWIGVFMLFLMVVPCSIIGPLTVGLPAHDAYVKSSWRFQGWTILAVILLIVMYVTKWDNLNFKRDFSYNILVRHAYLSIFTLSWATGYVLGCSLTITSHADIMYWSSGVWIFIITLLTCKTVHKLEIYGYFIYLIGVYLMFTDPSASKTWMDGQSYIGDLYAFIGAGSWAVFTYLNKINNPNLHPMVTLTQMFVFWTIYQFIFFSFLSTSNNFFSFDPTLGVFGWLNDSYSFFLLMWINAPITGILANIGFFSSFKYFPIEIVAGVMLIEPFFAQLAGVVLGQDEIPGIKTIIGIIVITVAFVIVGFGAKYKTQDELKKNEENLSLKDLEMSDIHDAK